MVVEGKRREARMEYDVIIISPFGIFALRLRI